MEIYINITINTNQLVNDFHALVELGCRKKTQFECISIFTYLPRDKRTICFIYLLSDNSHYGLSKKGMIHYTNDNFNEFRDDYFKKENILWLYMS